MHAVFPPTVLALAEETPRGVPAEALAAQHEVLKALIAVNTLPGVW